MARCMHRLSLSQATCCTHSSLERTMPERPRIAIATVWDANKEYQCAVLPWCQHARSLGELLQPLGTSDIFVLLIAESADARRAAKATLSTDCVGAKVHRPDSRLRAAVRSFAKRGFCRFSAEAATTQGRKKYDLPPCDNAAKTVAKTNRSHCRNFVRVNAAEMLYKWWFASLTSYQLVVYADLDVQLLRPEQPRRSVLSRWAAGWGEVVPADGNPRVIGSPDSISPFNAGLWTLSHPSTMLYELGLRLMRTVQFNKTHGFGRLGRPRALTAQRPWLSAGLQGTRVWKRDLWDAPDLPYMDCDQGLLYYIFYLHLGIGRVAGSMLPNAPAAECRGLERRRNTSALTVDAARARLAAKCIHVARHHYGVLKPWRLALSRQKLSANHGNVTRAAVQNGGRVAQFLSELPRGVGKLPPGSACAAEFASFLQWLPAPSPVGTKLVHHGKLHRVGP